MVKNNLNIVLKNVFLLLKYQKGFLFLGENPKKMSCFFGAVTWSHPLVTLTIYQKSPFPLPPQKKGKLSNIDENPKI